MYKCVKFFCIILIILIFLNLYGCKNNSTSMDSGKDSNKTTTKAIEINYWIIDWGGERIPIHAQLVENFNNKNPGIKVKMQAIAPESGITAYDTKLIASMVADNSPDVIMIAGRSKLSVAAEQGFLADITEYLQSDSNFDMDIYYPAKVSEVTYKGQIYALPETMNVIGILAYNKSLFKNAGIDPNSPPHTLDKLDTYAEKITKTDDMGNYIQLGFFPWDSTLAFPEAIVKLFGGSWWDADGNPTPTNSGNIKAFEWLMKYVNKYGYEKVNNFCSSLPNPSLPILSGKLGMAYTHDYGISLITKDEAVAELGVASFPAESDDINPTWLGGWCVAVSGSSKNKAQAVEFIKYHSGMEGQEFLAKEYSKINIEWQSPVIEVNRIMKDQRHPIIQFIIENIFSTVDPISYPYVDREYYNSLMDITKNISSGKGEMIQILQNIETVANARRKQ